MTASAPRRRRLQDAAVRARHCARAETRAAVRATAVTAALVIGTAIIAAGCGSTTARTAARASPHPASLPLSTSVAADQATWAVVPMGRTGENLFWQLFVLPAGASQWTLATPPGVATNGAIALGAASGRSLVAAIHPSLLLRFSPVISTANGGKSWTPGTPSPSLANVPDALAAAPDGGQLIALDRRGEVRVAHAGGSTGSAGPAGSTWSTAASARDLAASPAGRACRPAALTAVAFGPAGAAVLGSDCARPGAAGIFADQGGHWRAAGPALPGALGHVRVQVLRLVRTGDRLTALLQAGTGPAARLLAAWQAGGKWTLSPALTLPMTGITSSSFGRDGAAAVELGGRRAQYLAGPGSSWQALPALPPGRAVTLALPPGAGVDALAADRSTLTAWRLRPATAPGGTGTWTRTQTARVPIQYGSSG